MTMKPGLAKHLKDLELKVFEMAGRQYQQEIEDTRSSSPAEKKAALSDQDLPAKVQAQLKGEFLKTN